MRVQKGGIGSVLEIVYYEPGSPPNEGIKKLIITLLPTHSVF